MAARSSATAASRCCCRVAILPRSRWASAADAPFGSCRQGAPRLRLGARELRHAGENLGEREPELRALRVVGQGLLQLVGGEPEVAVDLGPAGPEVVGVGAGRRGADRASGRLASRMASQSADGRVPAAAHEVAARATIRIR